MIHISKYPCCNEDECECKIGSTDTFLETQSGITSALTLQLWQGFYHDRYRDIVKVLCYNIRMELTYIFKC